MKRSQYYIDILKAMIELFPLLALPLFILVWTITYWIFIKK